MDPEPEQSQEVAPAPEPVPQPQEVDPVQQPQPVAPVPAAAPQQPQPSMAAAVKRRSSKVLKDVMGGLSNATAVGQVVFHYGYVPFILYLGFRRGAEPGMPPLSIFNLLWS